MRGLRRWIMAAALCAAAAPEAAVAQMPMMEGGRRMIRIGFGGGVSVPTRDAADVLEQGVNGQAYLLVDTGVLPPFRFNLGYQKFDFKDAVLGGATGESSILSGVAGLSMNLVRLGPLTPYVTAGLGAFHIRDALEGPGSPGTETATRFGIDGGAGLTLRLGRLEGFLEARLQNVYTEAGVIDTRTIQSVPVTFGILF